MAKKKPHQSLFSIEESQGRLHAVLIVNGGKPSEFEDQATPVRIRYPKPSVEDLLAMARSWPQANPSDSAEDYLNRYLRSIQKDIEQSFEKIRQEVKRIQAATECLERAKVAQTELKKPG